MQGNNHAKLHIFFVLTTSKVELLYQSPLKKGVIVKKTAAKASKLPPGFSTRCTSLTNSLSLRICSIT